MRPTITHFIVGLEPYETTLTALCINGGDTAACDAEASRLATADGAKREVRTFAVRLIDQPIPAADFHVLSLQLDG